MTSGVTFFAYNTEQINYLKLAVIAARYSKLHMPKQPTALITDTASWEWFSQNSPEGRYADLAFDELVITEQPRRPNRRVHHDSPYTKFVSEFKNGNKHRVIEYSPFDQTLLLDIDYIVHNNDLEYVFDGNSGVTLFHGAEDLIGRAPHRAQRYLYETGIPMLWSTAVYFDRKDELAQMFFDIWAHVSDNYDFYRFLYNFPGDMFRTDFCVSIAAHMMNGMGAGELIEDFKSNMIFMSQRDDIAKISSPDDWAFIVNDHEEEWRDTVTRITDENVHVMNKRALERHFDDIMEGFDK